MTETEPLQAEPTPAKSSAGKKWAIGCGIGCLVLVLLALGLAAFGAWGYKKMMKHVDEWSAEFEAQGYEKVIGQSLDVHDTIETPTVYVGQMVRIFGNSSTDVAIIAQMGEVHGRIEGDVSFRGQILTLQPNAVITGDIIADAQAVQVNKATVLGEISGSHQLIDNGMRRQIE